MSLLPSRTSLFDDLFHDMASGFYIRPLHGDPLPSRITLDLRESDGGYLLQAELPGVAKEDIQIDVHGKLVTLKAEIRQHDSQGKKIAPCAASATMAACRVPSSCRWRWRRTRSAPASRTASSPCNCPNRRSPRRPIASPSNSAPS